MSGRVVHTHVDCRRVAGFGRGRSGFIDDHNLMPSSELRACATAGLGHTIARITLPPAFEMAD